MLHVVVLELGILALLLASSFKLCDAYSLDEVCFLWKKEYSNVSVSGCFPSRKWAAVSAHGRGWLLTGSSTEHVGQLTLAPITVVVLPAEGVAQGVA